MEQLLSAGANAFLAMPYELKDLNDAVDRCLPIQRLRRRSDPQNPAPVRLVVVDDDEWFVEMTTMLIRSKFEVALTSFTFSVEARDELQRTDPDMLIVGGVMPEISGEEIVRGLMARKITYPILVVSGYLSSDVVLGWFPGAPNISFLQKPFTVEQLVGEVEKHFEPVPAGK
jgi:FixJ family two-component response regulator